jgi:hypothetical protein
MREILSSLEGLGLPIEKLTVGDVLGTLNELDKAARAKGEFNMGECWAAQAGRIRGYGADDCLPVVKLIDSLERNKEGWSRYVYLWSLQADIIFLEKELLKSLLYNVVEVYGRNK